MKRHFPAAGISGGRLILSCEPGCNTQVAMLARGGRYKVPWDNPLRSQKVGRLAERFAPRITLL
jgi:hypothetical protein